VFGAPSRTDEIDGLIKLLPASSSSHGLNSFISSVWESSVADQCSVGRPGFEESVFFRKLCQPVNLLVQEVAFDCVRCVRCVRIPKDMALVRGRTCGRWGRSVPACVRTITPGIRAGGRCGRCGRIHTNNLNEACSGATVPYEDDIDADLSKSGGDSPKRIRHLPGP